MIGEEDLSQVSGGAWTAEYWDAGVMPVSRAGIYNYKYVLQTSRVELGWIEAGEAVIYKKYTGRQPSSRAEIKRFMKDDWPRLADIDSSGGYPNMHD